jgi:hypothetical protein
MRGAETPHSCTRIHQFRKIPRRNAPAKVGLFTRPHGRPSSPLLLRTKRHRTDVSSSSLMARPLFGVHHSRRALSEQLKRDEQFYTPPARFALASRYLHTLRWLAARSTQTAVFRDGYTSPPVLRLLCFCVEGLLPQDMQRLSSTSRWGSATNGVHCVLGGCRASDPFASEQDELRRTMQRYNEGQELDPCGTGT